ncbi:MAG TPA: NAD(P)H-hydrate dehydratase [Leptolyngbyaceae cyanobacterium M33_DOE_097]|uniref:Bifunctional NAD(P)H-hydrate repair enzyme n=1 Tax=Oscillatoriales cyanobacterium SpSt-418 TaxID=2282169 RepID=A0A7C3KGU6_9CYAN|nr:NAD(P)H-hydrate dehydratase [Leptolyngbyaceae cyanobacterium M33_DOE_097]
MRQRCDRTTIQKFVVTAAQMRQIEERSFAAGMPVAALMEKVGAQITQRVLAIAQAYYSHRANDHYQWGILVGPGHNGGDALVVARELHLRGQSVQVFCPFTQLKELTDQHARYCRHLGIPFVDRVTELERCDVLIDGLFGFGLERALTGEVAAAIAQINQWQASTNRCIISIDLPSGLHTDTGEVLGTVVQASQVLCLGLWKQGLVQEPTTKAHWQTELLDIGLPLADITTILGDTPQVQRLTTQWIAEHLPLPRPITTHKYAVGHLLLICGSEQYAGGAILTALGARASGVGMLTIAIPSSLKPILTAQIPEALVIGCPETADGAIAELPAALDFAKFQAIACGPGLTLAAQPIVEQVMASDRPLILDADGLNALAQLGTETLRDRPAATILTPHLGEFRRLFPTLAEAMNCRITTVQAAAQACGAVVLLKGARTAISAPDGTTLISTESSPGLARGGSGDVLTGLIGGLLAQLVQSEPTHAPLHAAAIASWLHAQAGIASAQRYSQLGVDPITVSQQVPQVLRQLQSQFTWLHST